MIKIAYPKALLYLLCLDIGLHLLEIAIDLHQYLGIFGDILLWAGIA
jgi:hypothetical protein